METRLYFPTITRDQWDAIRAAVPSASIDWRWRDRDCTCYDAEHVDAIYEWCDANGVDCQMM